MDAEAKVKGGWNAIKNHWVAFLIAAFVLVVLALWYDYNNSGKLTQKVAGWPIVGKLFSSPPKGASAVA